MFIVGQASNQTKSIMLATNSGDDNREDWILAIRNTMKLIQEDIIHVCNKKKNILYIK